MVWCVGDAKRHGFLLGNGAVGRVFPLDVQQVSTLWEMDGGRDGPLSGLLDDIPLAEANGGVFVTVS